MPNLLSKATLPEVTARWREGEFDLLSDITNIVANNVLSWKMKLKQENMNQIFENK